jgi:putative tricarboxylic transport membrane protein
MTLHVRARARLDRSVLGVAGAVAGLGLMLLLGGTEIPEGAGYDRIGPRLFPYAIGTGLVVLGLLVAVAGPPRPRDAAPIAWAPLGYIASGFLLFLLLMQRAGFVVAAALQFWLVARALRSGRPLRDAIVAIGVSALVYLAFSRGLGLDLPGVPFAGR